MEIALVMVAGSCIKQHLTLSILFDAQHGFGGLVKNSRGIVQFGLSPFRQKAVGQHFTKVRRVLMMVLRSQCSCPAKYNVLHSLGTLQLCEEACDILSLRSSRPFGWCSNLEGDGRHVRQSKSQERC
eukprot:TRINITY_DN9729_c0_g1_i2.p1 TRINITY_DN9729_c0_g1~~TRINITY_DN9729_c0_g1_i2.p1  ORF type:complete len:127 (+),score=4.37 TRINITY_DN9729_c0_g1_i2:223-603(+)